MLIYGDYNVEELEFLSNVLAFGVIDTTMDCLNYKTIGLGLCESCPHKRICNDIRKIMIKIDELKETEKGKG